VEFDGQRVVQLLYRRGLSRSETEWRFDDYFGEQTDDDEIVEESDLEVEHDADAYSGIVDGIASDLGEVACVQR